MPFAPSALALPPLATSIFAVPGFAEPVSSWTHLGAAGVALILGVPLVRRGRGRIARTALSVFVFSAIFLLSMSGVYHLLDHGGAGREVLRRLDHAGIWVLIAGTFTAMHVLAFRGWGMRWGVLLGVWTVAITGLVLKTIFFHELPEWVGLLFYLGLGWVGALTARGLRRAACDDARRLLIWGGVAYSVGAIVQAVGWPTVVPGVVGPHELFHLAVLAGLGFHWRLVQRLTATPGGCPQSPGARANGEQAGRPDDRARSVTSTLP